MVSRTLGPPAAILTAGRLFLLVGLPALWMGGQPALAAGPGNKPTRSQIEFFEKKVRPLLANNCFKCHGSGKQKGGLRLDSRAAIVKGGESGPAIAPGHPDKSELISAINYSPDGLQMPPPGKLGQDDIATLTAWVKMGAPWPNDKPTIAGRVPGKISDWKQRLRHWSFQPIRSYRPPAVRQRDWPRTPVDNFILARLEQAGLKPSPPVSKRMLLRRITFDLTGLPPTCEELAAFLTDTAPNAYERVVDRLLASPHYGERFGRHWLDLVRYAETYGHEFDYNIHHARPYRDYVIRAANDDLSYDRFVMEQIAGDLLKNPRRRIGDGANESVMGTACYWFGPAKHSPVDIRKEECDNVANQLGVFGKAFFGLTIGCARCHDHKFDPITADDYYALAGYLQSSRQQYAFIDDPRPVEKRIGELTRLKSGRRSELVAAAAASLRPAIDSMTATLRSAQELSPDRVRTASDESAGDGPRPARLTAAVRWAVFLRDQAVCGPNDPMFPWRILGGIRDRREFGRRRAALARELNAAARSAIRTGPGAGPFADFSGDSYAGWFVTGQAFGTRPGRSGDFVIRNDPDRPIAQLVSHRCAHSGLIAGRLQGTLRSSTFTINKRYIHYRVARFGGRKSPGRRVKNGQIHLIVDGFEIIKAPLYGGLTINIRNDGRFRWYTQDLRKFPGSRAYIEIADEDDGSIVVDRILFSDSPPPSEAPNGLIVRLLNDPRITSPEQLADRYQALFGETVGLWRSGRLQSSDRPRDRAALVNWMLRSKLFDSRRRADTPNRRLMATLLERYRELEREIPRPRRALAMVDGTGENEHLLIRGNPHKPGQEVPRRFLSLFGGDRQPAVRRGSGRLVLARQMVNPSNPLLARVIVNRLWHQHFGRGIVATPDDFGKMGQPPSHPKLLDYLALELIRRGWSLKSLHRMMLLSATYRMASRLSDARTERLDPQNILLHRMSIHRLEGEAIRDAILAVSGRLNETMYGPSIPTHLTPFMEGRGRPKRSGPLDGNGRRSIYINVRRNFLTPMFLAFDYPTPLTTRGRRSVSNVPAQALTLMNDPFVVQQARIWAEQVLSKRGESSAGHVIRLYKTAFSRPPTTAELSAALKFLNEQGREYNGSRDPRTWADFCHVLLNVKEFVFVR